MKIWDTMILVFLTKGNLSYNSLNITNIILQNKNHSESLYKIEIYQTKDLA